MSLSGSFGLHIVYLRGLPVSLRINYFHHRHLTLIITLHSFRFIFLCFCQ